MTENILGIEFDPKTWPTRPGEKTLEIIKDLMEQAHAKGAEEALEGEEMQYALQVEGTTIRDEPHRHWRVYEHAKEHADLLEETFGDKYEIVGRRKAGPWTVQKG